MQSLYCRTNSNLDTSVPSLHSSGRDSGLDLSRERSESPNTKQFGRIIQGSNVRGNSRLTNKFSCSHIEPRICNGDESRYTQKLDSIFI